jgi:hypothetical protein
VWIGHDREASLGASTIGVVSCISHNYTYNERAISTHMTDTRDDADYPEPLPLLRTSRTAFQTAIIDCVPHVYHYIYVAGQPLELDAIVRYQYPEIPEQFNNLHVRYWQGGEYLWRNLF